MTDRLPVTTRSNASASAALAAAIVSSRRGPSAPKREQRTGRVDRRRLARVAVADPRVFTRRGAPAPDKVRVTILVDASGSMSWVNNVHEALGRVAVQVCRELADATDMLPWVHADVVAFSTMGMDCVLYPLWETGQPTKNVDLYGEVTLGGTEEGYALAYTYDALKERIRDREQGLIIIISDGGPSEPLHVASVVRMCREGGIPVVSVALTESAQQPKMYGLENVIVYDGNSRALARGMAKVIGRVL
jgi:Mg-chelatase subunit ChlD